ncbi:P-loop containing nucleoside triphosphate hydrolase protein [Schizopora paradoxa]|uniref:p-loop containing nucleoside triphosphate hydrolase protein n=1 Tax=Schizopora paradoxa TaxID=27342 RepID=A0A0H2SG82_9AGAM|nr:P-loop containing nucleoside triphosphate hydrolase protein [Schizopora paradoxa]
MSGSQSLASSSQSHHKKAKTSISVSSAAKLREAAPLAERLRPKTLSDFIGQAHLTGPGSLLMNLISPDSPYASGSIIFWGPPGCGKTTLARLLAHQTDAVFKELSATVIGINEVRQVFEEAKGLLSLTGRKTILFLDEIHRFNRAQQDIFLPYIEQGYIRLIGATTENPSFKINGALLSRCRSNPSSVFVLERLTDEDMNEIIYKAIARVSSQASSPSKSNEHSVASTTLPPSSPTSTPSVADTSSSQPYSSSPTVIASSSQVQTPPKFPEFPHITQRILNSIVSLATGDARTALSLLELTLSSHTQIGEQELLEALRRSVSTSYDRTGDSHYDLISALHKSVRGSDGSAAMYWLARMLSAGEDPLYIARRMVVCASEDIGLADPKALPLAMAALQACQVIGMPECRINLAHIVAYLSEAPKSTRAYEAYKRAEAAAKQDMTLPVPLQIRNAPTRLMDELGYGEGYRYNPEFAHPVTNDYLPPSLKGSVFLRKEGDNEGKTWDEEALRRWEEEENGGQEWAGRPKDVE